MERILGIDPGSVRTGYGVIEADAGRISFVACGIIRTNTKASFAHRLHDIFEGINQVVQIHAPNLAAIEDVFVSNNPRSALKLGQARGAAVIAAMENNLEVYDYSPRAIKQAVAGYGQATKEQVQHMIRALLNLRAAPSSDAADALAVAICHANQMRTLAKRC